MDETKTDFTRRDFLRNTALVGAGALAAGALFGASGCASAPAAGPAAAAAAAGLAGTGPTLPGPDGFALPELQYAKDALAPWISAETFDYHHGKHHAGYIRKLNASIAGTRWQAAPLEQIILEGDDADFNNAAQTWNHSFFWRCLKPGGGAPPTGPLAAALDRDLGGFDAMKRELAQAAGGQFGSGWGWLVVDGGKLRVTSTADADLPMKHGQIALFTIDVWEHAYYIDHRNDRGKFVAGVLDHLANWDYAAALYAAI